MSDDESSSATTGEEEERALAPSPSDGHAEAPDQPELNDEHSNDDDNNSADIGNQRMPVKKMSGAGYDVVVDVDEEVSFPRTLMRLCLVQH